MTPRLLSLALTPTTAFLLRVAAGVLLASLWFGLPGLLLARLAGLEGRSRLLLAPILGAAAWGTASCLLFQYLPYRRGFLLAAFTLFTGTLLFIERHRAGRTSRSRHVWAFLALSLVLGSLAIADITPVVKDGALFVGAPIYDHGKAAIVDAIAREGLPPISPYYHPGREVPLSYYYLWHFLASQLRALIGISGWEADAALTWWTLAAVLSLVAGVIFELGGSSAGALLATLLLTCGSAITGLVIAVSLFKARFGARILLPLIPWKQDLQTLMVNVEWAPQHVLAAATAVLALVIAADVLMRRGSAPFSAWVLAALLACTAGCSAWVALAAAFAAPVVAVAFFYSAWRGGLHRDVLGRLPVVAAGGLGALVLAAPVLFVMMRGDGTALIDFAPQQTMESPRPWLNFALWWIQLVPAVYGATALFGALGLTVWRPTDPRDRLVRAGSAAAVPWFLLVGQCVRSTISANDLGWRAHLPAYLLLCVFAAFALSWLTARRAPTATRRWSTKGSARLCCGVMGAVLLGAGLLTSPYPRAYRAFVAQQPSARLLNDQLDLRRDFLEQDRAWQIVRSHAGPDGVVQSNPDGYSTLVPLRINLSYMLFADRTSAVGSANEARVFARGADAAERELAIRTVARAFQGDRDPKVYESLRRELGIDVLLVDHRDPLFLSNVLDASSVWRLVHAETGFLVYVARDQLDPTVDGSHAAGVPIPEG